MKRILFAGLISSVLLVLCMLALPAVGYGTVASGYGPPHDGMPAGNGNRLANTSHGASQGMAVYNDYRSAHNSAGVTEPGETWYLAEGSSAGGFETWILIQNPGEEAAHVNLTYQTEGGEIEGPAIDLGPKSRESVNVADTVSTYNVSTIVTSTEPVIVERAMYYIQRLHPPLEGNPRYPFTRDESIACGHWSQNSLDYPYFGAPRSGGRLHAGIDIYPAAGEGAPVRAMKDGTVIKVGLFYTRHTGEKTYAILIDHGDFVVNYAELRPPSLQAGDTVGQGNLLGYISGTKQLHFDMYRSGTTNWMFWYGSQPANLLDPTELILKMYGIG